MTADKCFLPLYRFCASLDEDLSRDDCAIAFDDKTTAKLCQQLKDSFYTYLVLSDGLCHEVINICYEEGLLYIERGLDMSDKQSWPCGTKVSFEWTPSAIIDLKDAVEDEKEECPEELFTGEICDGNCTVHFKDGVATQMTVNKKQLVDACYENPVITIEDGKIKAIAEGANTYTSSVGCCG